MLLRPASSLLRSPRASARRHRTCAREPVRAVAPATPRMQSARPSDCSSVRAKARFRPRFRPSVRGPCATRLLVASRCCCWSLPTPVRGAGTAVGEDPAQWVRAARARARALPFPRQADPCLLSTLVGPRPLLLTSRLPLRAPLARLCLPSSPLPPQLSTASRLLELAQDNAHLTQVALRRVRSTLPDSHSARPASARARAHPSCERRRRLDGVPRRLAASSTSASAPLRSPEAVAPTIGERCRARAACLSSLRRRRAAVRRRIACVLLEPLHHPARTILPSPPLAPAANFRASIVLHERRSRRRSRSQARPLRTFSLLHFARSLAGVRTARPAS